MSGVCTRTGLAYVDGPVNGFRIAKTSYGPLNPPVRPEAVVDRSAWSRFDTPGSTVYLSGDAATAYAETLAMARISRKFRSAITFAAEFYGMSWEEAYQMVHDEWTANSNMIPGWLPRSWRESRLMYTLQVSDPVRWIDLTAADTIAALDRHLGDDLQRRCDLDEVTLGTLAGPDRAATTLIAEWIREQVLDDGSYAAGVQFHSKYGSGLCWAYWMRRRDDQLGPDAVSVVEESSIDLKDPDLQRVLARYEIDSR